MASFFGGVWVSSTMSVLKENKTFLSKVKRKSKFLYFLLNGFMYSPLSFFIMTIQTVIQFIGLIAKGICKSLSLLFENCSFLLSKGLENRQDI